MNKKNVFSLMMAGLISVGLVATSFAQTMPEAPITDNAVKSSAPVKKSTHASSIKKSHKHHKLSKSKKTKGKHSTAKKHVKAAESSVADAPTPVVNN